MPDLGGAGASPIRVTAREAKETAEVKGTLATLVTWGLTMTTPGTPVMVTLTPRPVGRCVTGENVALFIVQLKTSPSRAWLQLNALLVLACSF